MMAFADYDLDGDLDGYLLTNRLQPPNEVKGSLENELGRPVVPEKYKEIVEDQRLEGLLFKDLSAPYVLGDKSKELRYWHKFKPDYFEGSSASDLDLVVGGA